MEKFKEYMLTDAKKDAVTPAKKDANKKTETPVVKKPSKETIAWWNSHNTAQQKKHVADNPDADIAKHVNAGHLNYGEKVGGGKSGNDSEPENTTGSNTKPTKADKTTIKQGADELGQIDAMANLSPEEKIKQQRKLLSNKQYNEIPEEAKEKNREQARVTVPIMVAVVKEKKNTAADAAANTEKIKKVIEKKMPDKMNEIYPDILKKVQKMEHYNDMCGDNRIKVCNGKKPPVGTLVSMVNELATGDVLMNCFNGSKELLESDGYTLNIEKTVKLLMSKYGKTKAGQKNQEKT